MLELRLTPDACLLALAQEDLAPETALTQAEAALEQAHADPRWALVACMALWRLERYSEAYELHCSYQHHFQNDAAAWVIAGMCARRVPQHEAAAERAFRKAIELDPIRGDTYYNLGNLFNDAERYGEAVEAYQRSLAHDPQAPLVWHNLGIALRELEQLDAAEQAMQKSLQLDPHNADTWCNLGLVAHARQNFELAKRCYLHAIQLDQGAANSWVNLGMSLLEELKPEQALPALRRGHSLNPSCPDAVFNLALTLLLMGQFEEGWRLYESRFTSKNFKGVVVPSSGPWITNLSELEHLRAQQQPCLIWSEQGIGDCIQFIRYLPLLQQQGIPFGFATRPALVELFRHWGPPGISVHDETTLEPQLKEAPHLALLSLPRLLRTELHSIPSATPYITPPGPPPERLLVPTPPGGIAVGLVWASNRQNKAMYRLKSLQLQLLLPRLLPAVHHSLLQIHSLQVDADADQLHPFEGTQGIHNWNGWLNDFADTAHVLNQLDLVISVDTAVAHLSAALAIPTWILLPSNADFRWLLQRSDSPWYEMVRLFRQPSPGDWPGAIDQLIDTLGEVLGLDLDRLAEVEP